MRISTLSISAEGMVFRSMTPLTFEPTSRVPSSSTNVRVGPKPRRSTFAWPPFDGLFEVVVTDGTSCGSVLSTCSTCTSPERLKASASMVTTGLGASKSCRMMRVPVTTTSLIVCAGLSCALAGIAVAIAAAAPVNNACRTPTRTRLLVAIRGFLLRELLYFVPWARPRPVSSCGRLMARRGLRISGPAWCGAYNCSHYNERLIARRLAVAKYARKLPKNIEICRAGMDNTRGQAMYTCCF